MTKSNYTPDKKRRILGKTGYRCAHCGCRLSLKTVTMEHVIPKSRGGTRDDSNLVPMCWDCNNERDNSRVDYREYYRFLGAKSKKDLIKYLTKKRYSRYV